MPKCRSCQAEILWRKHTKSRQMAPIDLVPKPGGNLAVLDGENYAVVSDKDEITRRVDLHFNHWVTCSSKDQHRKGKS